MMNFTSVAFKRAGVGVMAVHRTVSKRYHSWRGPTKSLTVQLNKMPSFDCHGAEDVKEALLVNRSKRKCTRKSPST